MAAAVAEQRALLPAGVLAEVVWPAPKVAPHLDGWRYLVPDPLVLKAFPLEIPLAETVEAQRALPLVDVPAYCVPVDF